MGEKIVQLAGKLGIRSFFDGPKFTSGVDSETVALARIYVPPHVRVTGGKTINVDGYWREMSDANAMSMDEAQTALQQIGTMNVLGISGGRKRLDNGRLVLPVSSGYAVEVELNRAADTYTVRRTHTRAGKKTLKGEQNDVYVEDLGETAYQAGMYKSSPQWGNLPDAPSDMGANIALVGPTPGAIETPPSPPKNLKIVGN